MAGGGFEVRPQVGRQLGLAFAEQDEPHVGEAVELALQGLARVEDDELLAGAEVVAIDQHQALVGQQLGLRKTVQRAPQVELPEADFVGQLGGERAFSKASPVGGCGRCPRRRLLAGLQRALHPRRQLGGGRRELLELLVGRAVLRRSTRDLRLR